jgi:DNA (cytosine-5)-methyltransferase 1
MTPQHTQGGEYRERSLLLGGDWQRGSSGLYLSPKEQRRSGEPPLTDLVAIDLFCGAGWFSLGFHQSGWHVAAAVEWDPSAAMTYLYNLGSPGTVLHFIDADAERRWNKALANEAKRTRAAKLPGYAPGRGWISGQPEQKPVEHFYLGDIRQITPTKIMDDLHLQVGETGCVFGGPPCQGFSMAGSRETMDPRNSLVFEFMHFVVAVKPKAFVMENVPGMMSMVTPEGVPVIDMLARIAQDGNFITADAFKRTMAAQADGIGFLRSDAQEDTAARRTRSTRPVGPAAPAGEQLNLLAA